MPAAPDRQQLPDFAANTSPEEVLAWAYSTFEPAAVKVTTAFGMEGCVLIDLLARLAGGLGQRLEVAYVDTGFFFAETHALRAALAARYPQLRFVAAYPAATPEQQAAEWGEALWRRDPDLCCQLRKVGPMRQLLTGAAAWITAVRRDQSSSRQDTALVGFDAQFGLVKVAPLAAFSRQQVFDHVQRHQVPVSELHFRGYPTFGCIHCTRPVDGARAGDYSRVGRWAGSSKTECGLHQLRPPRTTPIRPTEISGANAPEVPHDR